MYTSGRERDRSVFGLLPFRVLPRMSVVRESGGGGPFPSDSDSQRYFSLPLSRRRPVHAGTSVWQANPRELRTSLVYVPSRCSGYIRFASLYK